ncbi:MAG: extracellular solute-binding protein [Streptosporangiales bacterium]
MSVGYRRNLRSWAVALVAAGLLFAGCGNDQAAGASSSSRSASGSTSAGGRVNVLNAGSLENAVEGDLGHRFAKATPYDFRGYSAGSSTLANQIKGKVRQGDVFISADPVVNKDLRGKRNGDWADWWATFAKSPLVIGYNAKSKFADELKSKPWYEVLSQPGIRIGRTDPKLDPKGEFTVQALKKAEKAYNRPQLSKKVLGNSTVFPETDLVGRLQAGQLDAGFFYSGEVDELNIPSVDLGKVDVGATYTVTVLNHAPNRPGAVAFASYLLGGKGSAILKDHGFDVVTDATVSGSKSHVPRQLRAKVGG